MDKLFLKMQAHVLMLVQTVNISMLQRTDELLELLKIALSVLKLINLKDDINEERMDLA
jgi:hypothetical protein